MTNIVLGSVFYTQDQNPDEIRILNDSEAEIMSAMLLSDMDGHEKTLKALYDHAKEHQLFAQQLITIMLIQALGGEFVVDQRIVQFLSILCDRPGVAKLYAYSLLQKFKKEKNRDGDTQLYLDFRDFIEDCIPEGVPTEGRLHRHWEAQKQKTADGFVNILDSSEVWQ